MGHMIYKVDLNQHGEVSEWFKVTVLKTVEVNSSVGSNPTLSAILSRMPKRDIWIA